MERYQDDLNNELCLVLVRYFPTQLLSKSTSEQVYANLICEYIIWKLLELVMEDFT